MRLPCTNPTTRAHRIRDQRRPQQPCCTSNMYINTRRCIHPHICFVHIHMYVCRFTDICICPNIYLPRRLQVYRRSCVPIHPPIESHTLVLCPLHAYIDVVLPTGTHPDTHTYSCNLHTHWYLFSWTRTHPKKNTCVHTLGEMKSGVWSVAGLH